MLILPSKPSSPIVAGSFQHRHLDELSVDPAIRLVSLSTGKIDQRVAVDRLYESIAEDAQGHAKGSQVFRCRNAFLGLGARRSIVNQGTAYDAVRAVVNRDCRIHEPIAI